MDTAVHAGGSVVTDPRPFDFRPGAGAPRRQLVVLEQLLGLARERAGESLSTLLRTDVAVAHVTTEVVTYGEYVRSLPTVTSLTELSLAPLPGHGVLEIDPALGLLLLEQLTGGVARPAAPRRLTGIERALLTEVTEPVLDALRVALEPVVAVSPEVHGTAVDPRFLDLVPTGETVVLLVMQVTVGEGDTAPAGLLTLCLPAATLAPVLDRLAVDDDPASAPAPVAGPLADLLPDVAVELRVHLGGTPSSLADIVGLRVGDVLRLEHRVDEPVTGSLGDLPVLAGYLGRRGPRLALQVSGVTIPTGRPAAPTSTTPAPGGAPQDV